MADHPKSEKNPNGAGRDYHKIDWQKVNQALISGSTGTRIAQALGIHYDTLYKAVEREYGMKFTEYTASLRSKGEMLIEMAQFDEAVRKRDRGMLIWLGKQRLGQRDYKDLSFGDKGMPTITVVNYADKQTDEEES